MPETRTYTGSCHCGNVRYEVTSDFAKVISCNCSMCQRSGTLLGFAPATQFKLLSGEDSLQDYRFNRNAIAHLFCKNCGIKSFARSKDREGTDMVAINVRCLEGVEPDTFEVTKVNGRAF